MAKLRVHNFSISLDGFGAGRDQSLEDPLGVDGESLHEWVFRTRGGRQMIGQDGGTEGVDDEFFRLGVTGIGATVMGRNMFGPIRGEWGDEDWRGWWGDEPPYHHPVFVLTHHPHDAIEMAGGTTFNFVTDGIDAALGRAFDAAAGADVRLGGGVSTVQQYMAAGLVDEVHLVVSPVLLGAGERFFADGNSARDLYECVDISGSEGVVHVQLVRRS